ncbi:hypothetical protein OH77DRAFT_1432439 [Trametes cingulata]|nr:hypothetical protein OH77DRAFT_1432439 [Trametes cingulata]
MTKLSGMTAAAASRFASPAQSSMGLQPAGVRVLTPSKVLSPAAAINPLSATVVTPVRDTKQSPAAIATAGTSPQVETLVDTEASRGVIAGYGGYISDSEDVVEDRPTTDSPVVTAASATKVHESSYIRVYGKHSPWALVCRAADCSQG